MLVQGRLAGRIAVITGAAGGLGQAMAERLASEGADIAVADRSNADETRRLVEGRGRAFFGAECDVSSPDQVSSFAADVRSALGPADILINNAAVMNKVGFEDLEFNEWQRFMSVNVGGAFLIAKAFLEDLKRSKAGRIINMASTSYWMSVPQFVPYVSAKGALAGFTNSLATDLGVHGITVNSIAPSLVRTPGSESMSGAEGDYALLVSMQVLKREQTPADVAGVAAFLASDDAAFITGQIIVVDGGLTRR